jgi:hypothetical protein
MTDELVFVMFRESSWILQSNRRSCDPRSFTTLH